MLTIPRSQNHLAELLGIAKSICSRHKSRGMPTDSVEAARAWMNATLDPGRRKGSRFDQYYQAPPRNQRRPAPPMPTLAAQASALMAAADALLEANQPIAALVPSLRAALHAVPVHERDNVGLILPVMNVLVAHMLALWPDDKAALCDDGSPAWCNGETMTDSEAQEMGEFWYQVAAGEWLVNGCTV
jgi:hypothetical protein